MILFNIESSIQNCEMRQREVTTQCDGRDLDIRLLLVPRVK